jgi:methylated-DNA-[protein]-cysteine S-methyltransferase
MSKHLGYLAALSPDTMKSVAYFVSHLGLLEVTCSQVGISKIRFVDEREQDESAEQPQALIDCLSQLKEYFEGTRRKFKVPLDLSAGTEFYREVWELILAIPYGRTRSYSTIAETLGRPQASRAVGMANGRNPIPIIIPCHRVIGKDGSLTGYGYGLDMKEALLAIENPKRFAHQAELFS